MAELCDELDSAIWLAQDSERKLAEKHPDHEYLAYKKANTYEGLLVAWQVQLRKFSRRPEEIGPVVGMEESAHALLNYHLAIEVVLK